MSKQPEDPIASLTTREREVLEMLGRGLTNDEIGLGLQISTSTAKNHVASIFQKLHVASRAEAVGLAQTCASQRCQSMARAEPPAIAVLRFHCPDTHGNLQRYADGIAEDLTTRLSRCWYPVIARCSAFGTHGSDAVAIGRALSARYLVEGTLEAFDARVRLHVRLVDANGGQVLWAQRADASARGLFALLDQLAQGVMDGLFTAALAHMEAQQSLLDARELEPWQLAVRGMSHFWRREPAGNARARELFESALTGDPRHRLALYGVALTHQRDMSEQWAVDPAATVAALAEVSARFLAHWPEDSWALLMSSYAALYHGDRDRALTLVEGAIAREPSLLGGRSLHGQLLAMHGQTKPAVAEIERALRLSPHSPERWVYECVMALAYFAGEMYTEATAWARKAIVSSSRTGVMAYGVLASANAHLGDRAEAREAAAAFRAQQPHFSNARFRPMVASTRPDIAARYLDGLARACAW